MSEDLTRCLARLEDALDAARELGLDVIDAQGILERARTRLRFPSEIYVLALVGGTGVGKSSLLNALAGTEVSAASVKRPTTEQVHAWVPAPRLEQLKEHLAWLDVAHVTAHDGDRLGSLAILDLPDLDSVAAAHRAAVDALLPRVDAVAWVVDPEKYADEIIHGAYLRSWARRLARQLVVVNRVDIVSTTDAARIRNDLVRRLREEGLPDMPVALTRARDDAAGVAELRTWLEDEVQAKQVTAQRIVAEVRETTWDLAHRGGVEDGEYRPIIGDERRTAALGDAIRGVLALVDIVGLSAQAAAATRLAARQRGTGPMGLVTSGIYRLSGRARVAADPVGYLRRWRDRGSLAPAVEPLRAMVSEALPNVPSSLRPRLAALAEPAAVERSLVAATDRAIDATKDSFVVPRSRLWSAIGALQYVVIAALAFAALWFAALLVMNGVPVGVADVPILGPVPMPVMLLAGALLVSYLLALSLRLHAGWRGRRWGRRVASQVRDEITHRIEQQIFAPLAELESHRRELARSARDVASDCVLPASSPGGSAKSEKD